MMLVQAGQRWRHKATRRIALINWVSEATVSYRYEEPLFSKRIGRSRPFVSTVNSKRASFERTFVGPIIEGPSKLVRNGEISKDHMSGMVDRMLGAASTWPATPKAPAPIVTPKKPRRYQVSGTMTISVVVEVEASSPEEARAKAEDACTMTLCHGCASADDLDTWVTSGELDGTPEIAGVELVEGR